MVHGLYTDRRSHPLLSRHPPALGTAVVAEAIYRLACHLGRPPPALVASLGPPNGHPRVVHNVAKRPRRPRHETHPAGAPVQLQDARPHRTADLAGLEHGQPESDHHLEHRHDLHHLGHTVADRQDAADRPRQGGLRRALLRPEHRRVRQLRAGRQRPHV